ncbi:MAG: hypothetical protein KAI24_17935, partial [Planctomycetes bacterium]|nr:hypothetical protein [Planctomycetota bacterium]
MHDGSPKDRDEAPDPSGDEVLDELLGADPEGADDPGDPDDAGDQSHADGGGGDDPDDDDPDDDRPSPSLLIEPGDGSNSVVVQDQLPDTMFVFPLQKSVPFPSLMMPLLLDSSASRDIIAKAEAHNGYVFLVLQRDPEQQ